MSPEDSEPEQIPFSTYLEVLRKYFQDAHDVPEELLGGPTSGAALSKMYSDRIE